jgi:hypothetical protein
MNKKLFDDAIGEVPPSTVDVEAAIARGRRADRLRRVANPVLATIAAVAVLLGGMAVVLLSDGDAGGAPAGLPATSTTVPSPTSSPAPTTSGDPCEGTTPTAPAQPEKPAVTEDRLTAVLTELVSSRLPGGATLEQNPLGKDRAGRPVGPLVFEHWYSKPKPYDTGCQGGEDSYEAYASVTWSGGTGSIWISIGREGGWNGSAEGMVCPDPDVDVDQTSCRTETTPNGDLVMYTTLGNGAEMKGSMTNRLDIVRADQTSIVIAASNMATSGKYPGPPDASRIPLTHEQLKQIVLDPRVTMYPK